jgi:histidinol-phosphate/aromatic aminotransferase/cobyric acid decarboxylase-like protein
MAENLPTATEGIKALAEVASTANKTVAGASAQQAAIAQNAAASAAAQQQALEALKDPYEVDNWVKILLQERTRMMDAFEMLPICEKVYPTEANFFLAKMTDATKIYNYLVDQGIIVRNRHRVQLCQNCLRITIGTKSENAELIAALRKY